MEAIAILDRLRRMGLYPAQRDGRIRLYGDTRRLPPDLRREITDHRDALMTTLRRPGQCIAYVLIDIARSEGWHPVVTGDSVTWGRENEWSANPMPTPALRDALDQHEAEVIGVLLDLPDSCGQRYVCEVVGLCPAAVAGGTCSSPIEGRRDVGRPVINSPPAGEATWQGHGLALARGARPPRSDQRRSHVRP